MDQMNVSPQLLERAGLALAWLLEPPVTSELWHFCTCMREAGTLALIASPPAPFLLDHGANRRIHAHVDEPPADKVTPVATSLRFIDKKARRLGCPLYHRTARHLELTRSPRSAIASTDAAAAHKPANAGYRSVMAPFPLQNGRGKHANRLF